jgi:hypothetical protein
MQLSGATVDYKTRPQSTVSMSSTEAEFMVASDAGKIALFVRSILYDLDVPQEAATFLYEDNEGCIGMGNAQKPTTRTRHMDVRYFALAEWIERDLLHLARVDTKSNVADNFTKALTRILFYRHADVTLGHIPPSYSPLARTRVGSNSQPPPALYEVDPPPLYEVENLPSCAAAAKVVAPTDPWGFVQTMTPLFT